jgi:hypothetical protein
MAAATNTQIVRWAYWVNVAGRYRAFNGVVKVDFEVRLQADVQKLLSAVTHGWTPSQSWETGLVSWTPMPCENELVP